MNVFKSRGFIVGLIFGLLFFAVLFFGAGIDRLYGIKFLDKFIPRNSSKIGLNTKVVNEESAVIDVAEKVSPSVVTVSIQTERRRVLQFNPFGGGFSSRYEGGDDADIGTGFIVSEDGLIVTNKHVVSDTSSSYKVVTSDDHEYEVKNISRDPSNDIAILKIDAKGLKPVELGDSGNLKVGQFVVAIGTALGEFRHTVTTGVISGLGRGITAGSSYEGFVERLDDVIQTDAAINPGNSGGPLLNSLGQVIGINVAVAQSAQNIGFTIPVNIVKSALNQYTEQGGTFRKAYLGVEYQMISREAALLNDVPQGAYVSNVVGGSPAEKSGIKNEDIITKLDGKDLKEGTSIADIIAKKKVGDKVEIEIWRDGGTQKLSATLEEFKE